MPPKGRAPKKRLDLLTPAEVRRRLPELIRELQAQPSRRFSIGVGDDVRAVLVSPELLDRLDAKKRRKPAPAAVEPPAPEPVDSDDAPDRTVKRLVKRVINTVRD